MGCFDKIYHLKVLTELYKTALFITVKLSNNQSFFFSSNISAAQGQTLQLDHSTGLKIKLTKHEPLAFGQSLLTGPSSLWPFPHRKKRDRMFCLDFGWGESDSLLANRLRRMTQLRHDIITIQRQRRKYRERREHTDGCVSCSTYCMTGH